MPGNSWCMIVILNAPAQEFFRSFHGRDVTFRNVLHSRGERHCDFVFELCVMYF